MSAAVTNPFPNFVGTQGLPVNAGFVYVGAEDQDPQTNPIGLFWDEALTQPASQPVRTLNGYFLNGDEPDRLFTAGAPYSIRVRGAAGEQIVDASSSGSGADAELRAELAGPNGAALINGIAIPVPTRAALAGVNIASHTEALLCEGERFGLFCWAAGDYSSRVSRDPHQGWYVVPVSDPTGATGVWVRQASELEFEHFGAAGTFQSATQTGADDTIAVQAAIDFAYNQFYFAAPTTPRPPIAIRMSAKYYMVGNINVYNSMTIRGTGKGTTAFWARPGTSGVWWGSSQTLPTTDPEPDSSQKVTLDGIAWYGRSYLNITHIMKLGNELDPPEQLGTEGHIINCWFRDAPNGAGLWVNGNVAYLTLTPSATARRSPQPRFCRRGPNGRHRIGCATSRFFS